MSATFTLPPVDPVKESELPLPSNIALGIFCDILYGLLSPSYSIKVKSINIAGVLLEDPNQ